MLSDRGFWTHIKERRLITCILLKVNHFAFTSEYPLFFYLICFIYSWPPGTFKTRMLVVANFWSLHQAASNAWTQFRAPARFSSVTVSSTSTFTRLVMECPLTELHNRLSLKSYYLWASLSDTQVHVFEKFQKEDKAGIDVLLMWTIRLLYKDFSPFRKGVVLSSAKNFWHRMPISYSA